MIGIFDKRRECALRHAGKCPCARLYTGWIVNGSAAATAGEIVDFAFGSDTGGSVRIPASYYGLLGIRTSHGLIPLTGSALLAPGLTQLAGLREILNYSGMLVVWYCQTR